MKTIGVIPARLASTRLKEKVLQSIGGAPMIVRVYEQAQKAKKLSAVIVACDDERIQACIERAGGRAIMTRSDHPNGSSRVAEVASKVEADVILNIQGDEPFIHPENIDLLADIFSLDASVQAATLAFKKNDQEDFKSPNVVKVVCDQNADALYFSRAPLPHYRDALDEQPSYLKHLGIYGFKKALLMESVTWPQSRLESIEKLEQLRFLERGIKMRVLVAKHDSVSVDTADDLEIAESLSRK